MTDLAARLRAMDPATKRALLQKLLDGRRATGRSGPISHAQQRLWFLEQLLPGSPAYNEASAIRISYPMDVAALHPAVNEIVRRHEALRTTFHLVQGAPVQRVAAELTIETPLVDLTALDAPRADREVARIVTELSTQAFELARGPLLRIVLIRLGPADHVLAYAMHHIVCDGWSMRVFFDELGLLYETFARGAPLSLPPLPIQYLDFAVWQRDRLGGSELDASLAFWTQRLAGMEALQLPADRRRPALPSFAGGSIPISVPPVVVRGLSALCEAEGATLFMAGLTAFQVLLHRMTGQEDIAIGCPVAGRERVELEKLIGFFVNTLVMRGDLSGDPTFREALARTREMALAAYTHQDLPFERLVEELRPQRDPSRNPLFQATFQLQGQVGATALHGQSVTPLPAGSVAAKFDLRCDLWPDGTGGLSGQLEYNADLFEAETARSLVGHLEALLAAMARAPGGRISEAPLLTVAQERADVAAGHGPVRAFAWRGGVHERFAKAARRHPGRLAVAAAGAATTYRDIEQRANQLARLLVRRGVVPGDRVALLLNRSVELIVAALAAMKAGAAYLPLDPAYPAARIAEVLLDASARCLLATADTLPAGDSAVMAIDLDTRPERAEIGEPLSVPCGPEDVAYVIYTSGSTGRPRGVELRQAGLVNLIDWHLAYYAVTKNDRATLIASPGFDASVWEVWPYLVAGASLHVPDTLMRHDAAALACWMAAERITLTFLPTPLAEAFVAVPSPDGLALRALLTGGDRLRDHPRRTLPYRLVNHYGPTEGTVVATCCEVPSGEAGPPPVGRPIANVRAYVLDRHGRPVPSMARGELCLGGAGLARGYLGDEGLTRTRFVLDPFAEERGARMYRTGDQVHRRRDGTIEFHGRLDAQVKLRGHRVEPAEIEALLDGHPAVRRSLVVPRAGNAGLLAYVVSHDAMARPDETASTEELRRHLRAHLPSHMVPAMLAWVAELPLTPHGKLDRRADAALPAMLPVPDIGSEPPANPTEQAIAELWCKALGCERVARHDNFFDLGGHSLLLVQVHDAMVERLGTSLSIIDLFRLPTLSLVAQAVAADQRGTSASTTRTWNGSAG